MVLLSFIIFYYSFYFFYSLLLYFLLLSTSSLHPPSTSVWNSIPFSTSLFISVTTCLSIPVVTRNFFFAYSFPHTPLLNILLRLLFFLLHFFFFPHPLPLPLLHHLLLPFLHPYRCCRHHCCVNITCYTSSLLHTRVFLSVEDRMEDIQAFIHSKRYLFTYFSTSSSSQCHTNTQSICIPLHLSLTPRYSTLSSFTHCTRDSNWFFTIIYSNNVWGIWCGGYWILHSDIP